MAAADSTFLVCDTSELFIIPVEDNSFNALADASNSTGSVTSWKSTAAENIIIPIFIRRPLNENISPAIINTHESFEPKLAIGTSAVLKDNGAYPLACCIA